MKRERKTNEVWGAQGKQGEKTTGEAMEMNRNERKGRKEMKEG